MHCLLFWIQLAALAQDTPRATVRIEVHSNGRAVAAAAVAIDGAVFDTDNFGVVTSTLPLGTVSVRVTKEGFLPSTASLVIDAIREYHLAVELHAQEPLEQEITVTATRTGARVQDSPTRVEVLGVEEIEEKTFMTPGDIVMMLNEMGGLRVQTTAPGLGASSVRIQGMRGRYTRFLADGLPLFGQQGGGLGLLQIPPMDLGQVEVIKGVSSALYGAGGMGGVVNLNSRRPGDEPVHEFLVNRSSLGATDGSIFLASRLSPVWSASFLGGGHFQERRDVDSDGWANLAGYRRGVVRPRFFWQQNQSSGLITAGVTYEDREGGTVAGAVLPATQAAYREALDTRRYDVGGNYQRLAGGHYVVTARGSFSTQQHQHQFGEIRERDRHEMLFGEVAVRGAIGRHTWVAGAAVEREEYRPLDVRRFGYTYVTPGIFLQDDLSITRWLSVSASARGDFHNRFGAFFSPRVSALLRWGHWISRLSAGQGFFPPTPLTEETEAAGLTRLSIPLPLLAERGRNASFDLTRTLGAVSLTGTLFASRVRHPLHVDRDSVYQLINLAGSSTNRGAEFLATWRKSPFSATASYTFVEARETEAGVRAEIPLTPRHSFGIVGMWEKAEKWRLGVECYYTGRQRLEENPYRNRSEAYTVFGFLGERRIGRVSLFVNFENLGNVRQTHWDPLLRPARGIDGRWTVDAWAPLDGRVVNGGVRLRL